MTNPPNIPDRPKLRLIEPMWVQHQGQQLLYLRDPFSMSSLNVMLPEPIAPIVMFLDGSRSIPEIRSALALRVGLSLTEQDVRSLVGQLDQALMIENGEFRRAQLKALREYREAEHRPMSHSDAVYPESPSELESLFGQWCTKYPPQYSGPKLSGDLVGMLCPHIDYNRGHATYAELWQQAADDLSDVELVIMLGTDHYGGLGKVTLTRQSYATPYGMLRNDIEIVDSLAKQIGDAGFEEELHHTTEHSIELATVWLHHFIRERDVPMIPVLCGSFHHFTNDEEDPRDANDLNSVVEILSDLTEKRRTLVVAAGDLAHVGPAFGDEQPLDDVAKTSLKVEDQRSIDAICAGDADGFLDISRAESDRRKICGLPPIYIMLRLLEGSSGVHMGYDQCPADETNGSVVSIAGTLLYR